MPITFDYSGPLLPEVRTALDAGIKASSIVLGYYNEQSAETYTKGDGSPVTDADLAADRAIRSVIGATFPTDAFLTEEGEKDTSRLDNPRCWIVDPIDGTAQYVARTGMFDILIALVVEHSPRVAVAIQPVTGRIQLAVHGHGAWEHLDGASSRLTFGPPASPPRVVSSKWYGGMDPVRGPAVTRIAERLGANLKSPLDVGYQARAFSPDANAFDAFIGLPAADQTSFAQEWDLACVDLITHEAGGALTDCWGRRHRYNKQSSSIAGGILASSNAKFHRTLIGAVGPDLPMPPPALDPRDDGIS